jgi:hypothetical protein
MVYSALLSLAVEHVPLRMEQIQRKETTKFTQEKS